MITIEQINTLQNNLKDLKKDIIKIEKLKDRNSPDMNYNKVQKLISDINYQNYYIETVTYNLHYNIVSFGLANAFNDDYYKTVEYNPSQLNNSIEFNRKKPIKI